METSLTPAEALVAPWRRATLVAAGIAVVELTLVIALAAILLTHGDGSATAASRADTANAPATPRALPRAKTSVLVLNGNGKTGAAAAQADVVRSLRYKVAGIGNSTRLDHGRSTVLYVAGREREARRLAKELSIHLVGPLDGLDRKTLHGAHLAVILGR